MGFMRTLSPFPVSDLRDSVPAGDLPTTWRTEAVSLDDEAELAFGNRERPGRPLRRRQDDGLSQSSDWGYIWGFRGKYEQRLNQTFTLGVEGNVNALRDYVDHQIVLGISAQF